MRSDCKSFKIVASFTFCMFPPKTVCPPAHHLYLVEGVIFDQLKGCLGCLLYSSEGWYRGRIQLALSSEVPVPTSHCLITYPGPFFKELGKKKQKNPPLSFIHSLRVSCRPISCKALNFPVKVTEKCDIWLLFSDGHLCSCTCCPLDSQSNR